MFIMGVLQDADPVKENKRVNHAREVPNMRSERKALQEKEARIA